MTISIKHSNINDLTLFPLYSIVIYYNIYRWGLVIMGIICQTNNDIGITYAYENKAFWDKEKKQSRAKRKLIGRVDPVTGEIVPTRSYTSRKQGTPAVVSLKPGPVPIMKIQRSFYGASYLFDQIGKITGISDDIKSSFPNTYKQILSIA